MEQRPSAGRRSTLLGLCGGLVAIAVVVYSWDFVRFSHKWATIRKGDSWADVRALLGKPDRDTKMAELFGKDSSTVLREWYKGPWRFILYLEMDDNLKPTTVYIAERMRREWRDYCLPVAARR